ncbi:MAG: hypothetical protein QM820_08505 [Minicystis sp.]
MNIRSLTFVLGIAGAVALAACKSETGTNIGGAGGEGGNVGGGGAGGAACENSCATAITDGTTVCPDAPGYTTYEGLVACASTSCGTECGSLIAGGTPDSPCNDCLQGACKTEQDACNNDF